MSLLLRLENQSDYEEVENLTREAFWDLFQPGCDEHLVAHKLRKVSAFIPALDFVAVQDDRIVANIMYSKAKVVDSEGIAHEVITFGPLSVLPSVQKKGIGSALIAHTKELAQLMGYRAIVIFGSPEYYHRFGFVNAQNFGIVTSDGANFDAFMAMELSADSLQGITGRFYEDAVFHVDKEELDAFERKFPYKEKHVTKLQFR